MSSASTTSKQILGQFITALSSKQPTPGGGAAAAVSAAIGAAAAQMSAAYTQRKKDQESGASEKAQALISSLASHTETYLNAADEDAAAYADLQRTWKKEAESMTAEEKARIEARALAVPVTLLEQCHEDVMKIQSFLPFCNPNITSDAKVGIHHLAGAARAAFQTAMVNSPSEVRCFDG
jgi:Methenyl tetrahydrofolate cyclohydrolase